MTADEEFEKIGYKLYKETKSIIEYRTTTSWGSYDRVSFSLTLQTVNTTGRTGQGNPSYGSLSLPLLNAIYDKLQELGWL